MSALAAAEPGQIYGHDIIVVGASAGGVETLIHLVSNLPADLPAAMFIALHLPPGGRSYLPEILGRSGPLPVGHARDGDPIEHGRIYVGPPDHHLLVEGDQVRLRAGPKENGHRPAIDTLFRSAAESYGPRVVGVVLSGALDDGTAGLRAVRRLGGICVVQDPDEALFPAMPLNAIAGARPDHVLSLDEISPALVELASMEVPVPMSDLESVPTESDYAKLEPEKPEQEPPGKVSGFVCPECGGALWELHEGGLSRFRCRVGHAYSAGSLLTKHSEALEAALWTGYRALEERAAMANRLADRIRERGQENVAQRFEGQADDAQEHARTLREVLLNLQAIFDPAPGFDQTGTESSSSRA